MSFTYKPKKKKRRRTHGFLKRKQTKTGRTVVKNRRRKGRKRLTVKKQYAIEDKPIKKREGF